LAYPVVRTFRTMPTAEPRLPLHQESEPTPRHDQVSRSLKLALVLGFGASLLLGFLVLGPAAKHATLGPTGAAVTRFSGMPLHGYQAAPRSQRTRDSAMPRTPLARAVAPSMSDAADFQETSAKAATGGAAVAQLGRREAMMAAGAAALLTAGSPSYAAPRPPSDGKWARHEGAFDDEFFEGFEKSASGLEYKTVEAGWGVKPSAGQGIKAHYSGYLLSGAKFDSSYDRRSPLGFPVGTGRVIKGWDEALLDMAVGEQRILKIPPGLAYGSKGAGGVIPPGATLVFYVELVSLSA